VNLTDEECATFVNLGWQQGLDMVCKRRVALANKLLRTTDPLDSVRIAKAQAAAETFENDIPAIARDVNAFIQKGQTPSTAGVK
jgi:hypothetical protein